MPSIQAGSGPISAVLTLLESQLMEVNECGRFVLCHGKRQASFGTATKRLITKVRAYLNLIEKVIVEFLPNVIADFLVKKSNVIFDLSHASATH